MTALPARLADVGAECAILSAAVFKEKWLLDILQSVAADDFTRNETRAVFSVLSSMHKSGEKISLETIAMHEKELADAGFVKGRDMTLTQIVGNPPLSADFQSKLSIVKEMTARRAVLGTSTLAARLINQGEMADVAFAELEKLVMERTSTGMTREMLSPHDMAMAIADAVEERANKDARNKRVIYSSFGLLNMYCGGFEKGDLIILSAESGAGKSAFAMNLAYGIAICERRPLLYLNSEMSKNQFSLRWAAHIGKVSHSSLRNGTATSYELGEAVKAADVMDKSALWTLNMPDMQIASVLAEVRRAKARHNIEVAIVDYIGRMDTMNAKDRGEEWQMMKAGAQRLKTLAQELDITVIMVAQLTSDGGRLAQSSYMVHEADLWLNIARIKAEDLQKCAPWNYTLSFRKARNAEAGKTVMLRFDGDTLTFTDKQSEAEEMAKATQGVPL